MTKPSSAARSLGALAAVLLLASGAPAFAQAAPAPPPAALAMQDPVADQETNDAAIVKAAMEEFGTGGWAALARREADLKAVLGRAPASYPLVEERGDHLVVRTDELSLFIVYIGVLKAAAAKEGRKLPNVRMMPNTYGQASLMLGSLANEQHRYADAVAALDRGRALQPDNPLLAIERGGALMRLNRSAEAVAGYDAVLESGEPSVLLHRARLMRNKGVALIELNRLDEAEKMLEESLKIEPGNKLAEGELSYIAGLRKGGPTTPVQLQTPNQQEGKDH